MRSRYVVLAATLGMAMTAPTALADTLILSNGDRITGTFIEIDAGQLTFRPDAADTTLSFPLDTIAQLQTDDTIQILMDDGTEVHGQAVAADNGEIRLDNEDIADPVTIPVEQLSRVTGPATPIREPFRTSGDLTLGVRVTDGDTRTQTYSATADASVRTDANRFRFNAEYIRSRDQGEDTADNASGGIRYDYFVSEQMYLNSNVSLARDRFRDLRLRTTAGLGVGYQFFDTRERTLSAEFGVSYVNEDFYEADNQTHPAGRWAVDYEQRFAGNGIRLFHAQEGFVNLNDTEDVLVTTRTGVRFPFVIGMTGTLQVNVDYENQPPPDSRRTETTYILTAGYSW